MKCPLLSELLQTFEVSSPGSRSGGFLWIRDCENSSNLTFLGRPEQSEPSYRTGLTFLDSDKIGQPECASVGSGGDTGEAFEQAAEKSRILVTYIPTDLLNR